MPSYTRQIADFASGLRYTNIPEEAITQAKWLILDGLGCAFYASDLRWSRIMMGMVKRLEPDGGQASIWGTKETASAVNAALVNGTMVQGYELDDGSSSASFHGSAVVLPAALGAAEYIGAEKVSGEQLLTAIIAGFEIGPRVGICANNAQMIIDGWHAPAVVSSFAAALSAGIIVGLNSEQFFQALGIAGTQASGLMAAQFGSMVKRMQCAKNSQAGLYAALLAADGFTGIENIFEEKYGGFCSAYTHSTDKFNLPALVEGLGSSWEIMRAAIKIYACLAGNHTAVNAIEELMRETGLKAGDVQDITLGMTEAAVKHGGWWPYEPKGLTAAQMHAGFCVAMQLIEGEVFVDQMVDENVARPDLVELANRIKAVRSIERENRGYHYSRGCDVEVRLKNGTTLKKTVDFRPGSERRPLTADQKRVKFRRMAGKVLSQQQIVELEKIVWSLESAPTIIPLIDVLRGGR